MEQSATPSVAAAGGAFHGHAHGGQQPVSGATIQLYAAGATGYGSTFPYSSGTSLLGSIVVQTDANGYFYIPSGSYSCPSQSTETYLVASGGNPGLTATTSNPNPTNATIALVAALGACGGLGSKSFVNVNELTTVAFVWSLARFITGPTSVGTSATNNLGLANAFATAANVVSTETGGYSGSSLPAGATLPTAKINSLADILASCVNSAGGTAGDGSPCGNLFANTTVNGVAPTDTITAAINMAQNPGRNVAALINSVQPSAPFLPFLATAPNDLNIVISYAAGGFSTPRAVAIDPVGNVWVPNATTSTVTELNNAGLPLSGPLGYSVGALNVPVAIAIDQSGNAWVANSGNATASKILAGGSRGTAYNVGALPSSLAIDAYGSAFVANSGDSSISRINSAGTVTTTAASGASAPVGIALNPR